MKTFSFVALLALATPATLVANTIVDFEGLPDSTILTTQYSGLTFTNAIILTSGISLNEFEFPPHSGVNVPSDNGGPMSIAFASPIIGFSAYFTYAKPLTLRAFDASNSLIARATSASSNNEALSGVPGSSPNQILELSYLSGISTVTITGDPVGGSFVLDDMTTSTAASSTIPEPSTFFLFMAATTFAVLRRRLP